MAGLVVAFVLVAIVCSRVLELRSATPMVARSDLVVSGSIIVFAFVVVPLILQRTDAVDPRRFSLFGIAPRPLALGLAVSSLVALPVVALILFALSSVVAWSRSPLETVCAVVGGALAVATCVLVGRLSSAFASLVLSTRRAREVAGVIGVFVLVLLAPAVVLALSLNWGGAAASWSESVSSTLGYTPLGAAWALPAAAAIDDPGAAFLSFVVAVLTVAVLWLAWRTLVSFMVTSTQRDDPSAEPAGLGWFGRFPSTPAGAIAARSLTYWSRDPRYFVPLIIVPIVPILMAIPLLLVSFPPTWYALIPLPVMCLFLGFSVHNDVALDNSAIWLHVVSGKRGIADRVGRMAPVLLLGLPLIGIGSVVTVFLSGNHAALPSVLGASTCLLFTIMGLGSLISARFPYGATRPGDSPFTQPQSIGSTSAIVQGVVVLGTLALSAPSIVFAILAETTAADDLHWASLEWGVGVGVLVLVLGALSGGAVFNRRGPELLQASLRS
ncbi:ABC transporter permease [Subtercola vilae]|uniref:ABC transporter permease n=1 Tax=Subtercola vilae TaxID=2056433 RepID=A0A4T2BX77_9MICO|nr:ABC transporter permease [Subtercola vilae]